MKYGFLVFSVIITLTYGLIRNNFSKKHVQSVLDYRIFLAMSSFISMITILILAFIQKAPVPSLSTILLGIIFGVLTVTSALFTMRALEIGPMSYTSLITSTQLIIPAIAGQILLKNPVAPAKYVGVGLMVVSIILSVAKTKGENKKASFKWLTLCLSAMLLTGSIGVMQIIQKNFGNKEESLAFLTIAFLISTVYSLIMMVYYMKKKQLKPNTEFAKSPKIYILASVCGLFIGLANVINLNLTDMTDPNWGIDPIILFPVLNGAGLLLSIIASSVFLKEKLTPIRWVGIGIGIVAIACLCLDFNALFEAIFA